MATEEMKPETKRTEQKQKLSPQIKEDLPPPIQTPLPLPYKSCSLKVSIHCEGCKRKVKKVLTTIEGVCKVDIDVKQHKVTVIGITPPEILLKKLHKAGKNAELFPEIADPVENKPKPVDPVENKSKPVDPNKKVENVQSTDEATTSGTDKPENIDAGDCDKPVSKKIDTTGECGPSDIGENAPVKEENKEKDSVKEISLSPPADPPEPAEEKKAEETGGAGSGKVGKKKKKRAQNLTTTNNPSGGPSRSQSAPPPATAADHDRPFNEYNDHPMVPNHDRCHYPPPGYYAPPVMYGVSYNVAQPPLSVDAASSYYTPPPPPYSYAYMHYPGYQPFNQNAYSSSRPSDSFELFSDENPNGCLVM